MTAPARDPVLEQIRRMNQRGGRLLSLVDLVEARTLSIECAAHLAALPASGASIASGAKTGGVGKTNLLAAILAFTPPGTGLVTVEGAGAAGGAAGPEGKTRKTVYLCHEIGPGRYYSYLWGKDLREYFRRAGAAWSSIAFTIHADTPEEMEHQIVNPETGLLREDFLKLDALVFIDAVGRGTRGGPPRGGGGVRDRGRRVTGVYRKDDGSGRHVPAFLRSEARDALERTGADAPADAREEEYGSLLRGLLRKGVSTLEDVRSAFLSEFGGVGE